MSFYTVETSVASAVATSGTFTVGYPEGTDPGNFQDTRGHEMYVRDHQALYVSGTGFTLSFGAASITVTYLGSTTIPAGSVVQMQLDELGADDDASVDNDSIQGVSAMSLIVMDLGAPDVLDADFIIKAATSTELPDTETVTYTPDTDATSPTDGVAPVVVLGGVNYWELDTARNLVSTVTHGSSVVAMTWTVTGLDEFGGTVVETVTVAATGTSQVDATLKTFKWVRSIALTAAADAEANTVNLGTGDVLGLPIRLPDTGYVLKELQDGVAPTAGTVVAAVDTVATATTGDVRGTYDPNAACDGAKSFKLVCAIGEPTDKGVPQYAG